MVTKTCKSLIKYNVEHRRGNGKSYKGSKKKDERKKSNISYTHENLNITTRKTK
jgi:hypothetical protein